jgi:hypothetical protein
LRNGLGRAVQMERERVVLMGNLSHVLLWLQPVTRRNKPLTQDGRLSLRRRL